MLGSKERLAGTTTLGVELRQARYEGWSRDWDWLTFSGYKESTTTAHRGSVTWYCRSSWPSGSAFS